MGELRELDRWFAENPDHWRWYTFDVPENGVALDLGAYRGEWSTRFYDRNKCKIYAFEPIPEYYYDAVDKLKDKNIEVFNCGIGASDEYKEICINDTGSSFVYYVGPKITAEIVSLKRFMETKGLKKVNIIKINIEGCEYDLLDHIIGNNMATMFDIILVQFHLFVPNAVERRKSIQSKLLNTHDLEFNYEFIWECWKIR